MKRSLFSRETLSSWQGSRAVQVVLAELQLVAASQEVCSQRWDVILAEVSRCLVSVQKGIIHSSL